MESVGKHGVAIFFVLSGYLITTLLLKEKESSGGISLRSFYVRRFFRIIPCAWAYLACVFIAKHPSRTEMFSSLFFYRNYVDFSGNFGRTLHFWSLAIEEQFYLFWPPILALFGAKRSRWIAAILASGISIYCGYQSGLLAHMPVDFSFQTQYRADALLVGCAAALFKPLISRFLRHWMALPLLCLVIYRMCIGYTLIPLYQSASIALLILISLEYPGSVLSRLLSLRPLAFLGLISYSVYVWQQPFIPTMARTDAAQSFSVLAVFALGSYYCVERPCIRIGRKWSMRIMDS